MNNWIINQGSSSSISLIFPQLGPTLLRGVCSVCMGTCVCTCECRSEFMVDVFIYHSPNYILSQILSWNWSSPIWLDWLTTNTQGPSCPCVSSTSITGVNSHALKRWVLNLNPGSYAWTASTGWVISLAPFASFLKQLLKW